MAQSPPKPALAFGMAVLNVIVAAMLFNAIAEGPGSAARPVIFAVVCGVLGIAAAWYAIQAWRAGAGSKVLVVLALLIDIVIIGAAVMVGLATLIAPTVR